ncbi:hypothetical protein [Streptomyces sp. TRM68367]|uniref:hypothetical protein n=1 Tax=Streptomyces sp. TRM68367 TaxID=2758415 RepID=UPI00165BD164|nr:hypothetical protein [Streptomyces sp. TRM68367]MBC9723929.1 hypothetical protein [Streptomyces sp. TRM68367]
MSQTLVFVLLLLTCSVGMCLMMWLMGRHQRRKPTANQHEQTAGAPADRDAKTAEITRLRAEIDQFRAAQRDSAEQRAPGDPPREGS